MAGINNRVQNVKQLLSANANPNFLAIGYFTPLQEAVLQYTSDLEIIKLLLEAGGDPTMYTGVGESPVETAFSMGREKIIEEFEKWINIKIKKYDGDKTEANALLRSRLHEKQRLIKLWREKKIR